MAKHVERIPCKIKKTFPEENILIGEDEKKKEIIAQFEFQDLYPEDSVVLFGMFQHYKSWGKVLKVEYYREVINQLWLAKWLKVKKKLADKKIIDILIDQKDIESMKKELMELQRVQGIFQYLKNGKIQEKTLSDIEQRFRWRWEQLLFDPYPILEYPSVTFEQIQEVIKKFHCFDPISSKAKYLVKHSLLKAQGSGHFYLSEKEIEKKLQLYGIQLNDFPLPDDFVSYDGNIYLKENYDTECVIAENIQQRIMDKTENEHPNAVEEWEKETGFSLAKNQKEAVQMALQESFCVVTGGPGVGKTTVCKCITDILGKTNQILMVAPTGRAAKRANESTGLPTSTIHSLLGYNGFRFFYTKENPIETDVLVIDESSMIDAPLLQALLEATPVKTKIIFVGDVDQLPSVGPGQTLKDMIESKIVPVTRLTEIFRQAADSPIITLAYAVNRSELPTLEDHEDLKYIEHFNEDYLFKKTIEIGEKLYKENDLFDVQLLIPMYKGPLGIDKVNQELQKRLNPHAKSVRVGEYELRKNDKVIQTKNVKGKGIYNGDVGIITECSEREIKVLFQGAEKETTYSKDEFWDLQLSYAITVHRSQGSEYKYVIIPTVESYGNMLQKNLLYTAITRSKKKLWMLYQLSAFKKAIRPESVPERNTTLQDFLRKKTA